MQKIETVLGLSIGTRTIGAALLQGHGLLDAKVIVFRGKWDESKLELIMRKMTRGIKRIQTTAISLKIPPHSHHTPGLKTLIHSMKHYCHEHAIYLHICTIKELKQYGIKEGRGNKKILVQTFANKYPDLQQFARKEGRNRHRHYTKMFEAVAAAELLQTQMRLE